MSNDQDGCEWVSVSSGTGLPAEYPGSPWPAAVKRLCYKLKLSTVGGRAFPVAGPTIWNSLPDNMISAPSLSPVRQRWKHFCFFPHSLTLSFIPGKLFPTSSGSWSDFITWTTLKMHDWLIDYINHDMPSLLWHWCSCYEAVFVGLLYFCVKLPELQNLASAAGLIREGKMILILAARWCVRLILNSDRRYGDSVDNCWEKLQRLLLNPNALVAVSRGMRAVKLCTKKILQFLTLTLLVGHQEEHLACENWGMRCWCGYLSEHGADCLHMVQLMPVHPETPSSLASFKSRVVSPFWYRLTRVFLEKRPLSGCSSCVVVLNWRCWLTQVDLYNGRKTVFVVVVWSK